MNYKLFLIFFIITYSIANELEDNLKSGNKEQYFLDSKSLSGNYHNFGLGVGITQPNSINQDIKDDRKFNFKNQFQDIGIGPFVNDDFLEKHIPFAHNRSIGISIGFGSKESARSIALKKEYEEKKQQRRKEIQKHKQRQREKQAQIQIQNLLKHKKIINLTKDEKIKAQRKCNGCMPKKGLYLQITTSSQINPNIESILKGYDFRIYTKDKINIYLLGPFKNLLEIVAIKDKANDLIKELGGGDKPHSILYEVR